MDTILQNTVNEIILQLKIFLLFILSPVILVIILPLILHRQLVVFAAKIFHQDLGKIAPPLQHLLAHDIRHDEDRVTFNICTWHVVDGPLSVNSARNIVEKNFVLHRRADGQLEFPEAQQHFTRFGGYLFWKWDRDFEISHHVRSLEHGKEFTTEEDLQRIISRLISAKWPPNRSLWEILIVNNYKAHGGDDEEKSVAIFRFHHALADGYSYLNFMVRRICGANNSIAAMPTTIKMSAYQRVLYYLSAPYNFLWACVNRRRDVSPWSLPLCELRKRCTTVWSAPVPVDRIKRIKLDHRVGFQAVLNTIISGVIQRFMSREGQTVPQKLTAFIPIPSSGHPGGLCVHTNFGIIEIPVGEKHPEKRIQLAQTMLARAVLSSAPSMAYKAMKFLGLLPWKLVALVPFDRVTVGLSCFPGITGDICFVDRRVVEVNFAVGPDRGTTGAAFTTLTCFGSLRFVMTVDEAICASRNLAEDFKRFVDEEIALLLKSESPHNTSDNMLTSQTKG